MNFVYATGGREKYFKADKVGDCVTRAIANATGKDYLEVYNRLKEMCKSNKKYANESGKLVRNGVPMPIVKKYLEKELGWSWHGINRGAGESLHLTEDELPAGNLIISISKHLTNVRDGVIYDTYNCSVKVYRDYDGNLIRNDRRTVYGYWTASSK